MRPRASAANSTSIRSAPIARKAARVSMPTSATGICRSRAARTSSAGFTLLELLVVVAIIGLLSASVALSFRAIGNDQEMEQETGRLRGLIDLLREEALMQSRDYGLLFTETGYRFYVFDYRQLKWVDPPVDRLLEPHVLRPLLSMALVLEGREVRLVRDFESLDTVKDPAPQIMLLSSGEVTPFEIEMSRD